MTVIFRHHDGLEINRVDLSGSLSMDQLRAHARYRATTPRWLNHDHINVVQPGAHASNITTAALEALYAEHQSLFESEKLLVRRRSAWICQAPPLLDLVRYWISTRSAKTIGHTDVRLFESFQDAGQWLVLGAAEIAIAESGEGFFEVARF